VQVRRRHAVPVAALVPTSLGYPAERPMHMGRPFCIVAVQVRRGRRNRRMPQVVPHADEFHAALQCMGGMGVALISCKI